MITNNEQEDAEEKWHYIALKSELTDDGYKGPLSSLSRLFRGITSSNNGDFYCLGCLHSLQTNNALNAKPTGFHRSTDYAKPMITVE